MEGEMFWTVVRQFFRGDVETHSMEVKDNKKAATQRFFRILATDLDDETITYNACYVINSEGLAIEGRVFDRRPKATESEAQE